jgi:hypothetical protein
MGFAGGFLPHGMVHGREKGVAVEGLADFRDDQTLRQGSDCL